jgi:hypothetical protein
LGSAAALQRRRAGSVFWLVRVSAVYVFSLGNVRSVLSFLFTFEVPDPLLPSVTTSSTSRSSSASSSESRVGVFWTISLNVAFLIAVVAYNVRVIFFRI